MTEKIRSFDDWYALEQQQWRKAMPEETKNRLEARRKQRIAEQAMRIIERRDASYVKPDEPEEAEPTATPGAGDAHAEPSETPEAPADQETTPPFPRFTTADGTYTYDSNGHATRIDRSGKKHEPTGLTVFINIPEENKEAEELREELLLRDITHRLNRRKRPSNQRYIIETDKNGNERRIYDIKDVTNPKLLSYVRIQTVVKDGKKVNKERFCTPVSLDPTEDSYVFEITKPRNGYPVRRVGGIVREVGSTPPEPAAESAPEDTPPEPDTTNEASNQTETETMQEKFQLPRGFVTEKGSVYTYNPDGSVHRQKFDGTAHDQDIAVFLPGDKASRKNSRNLALYHNVMERNGSNTYIVEFDDTGETVDFTKYRVIFHASEIRDPERLALVVLNRDGTFTRASHVSLEPTKGSLVFEMSTQSDGATCRHAGHAVSEILTNDSPESSEFQHLPRGE